MAGATRRRANQTTLINANLSAHLGREHTNTEDRHTHTNKRAQKTKRTKTIYYTCKSARRIWPALRFTVSASCLCVVLSILIALVKRYLGERANEHAEETL